MNSVNDGMYRLLAEIVEQARRDAHGAENPTDGTDGTDGERATTKDAKGR